MLLPAVGPIKDYTRIHLVMNIHFEDQSDINTRNNAGHVGNQETGKTKEKLSDPNEPQTSFKSKA